MGAGLGTGWGALLTYLPSTLQLSNELKQHVTRTLSENYGQPGATEITTSVDRLQQDVSPQQGWVLSVPPVCVPGPVPYLCHLLWTTSNDKL